MSDFYTLPETLWDRLQARLHGDDREFVVRAYEVARSAHARQQRFEGTPYIVHPLRVALMLAEREDLAANAPLLAGALLHDVIEDSEVTRDEIAGEFGADVAEWVQVVTKPRKALRSPDWEDRYYAAIAAAPRSARLIKLADRLDNVRGLGSWPRDKQAAYVAETRLRVLPIATQTDSHWAAELACLCSELEQ
ncbi:MAG TPA: HD domain-containing protein [Ardenticatenaceae bacterium]|nr:HD domain-containing protein [Ardenticatenaceae bacterium]